jgi:hypothetical protein
MSLVVAGAAQSRQSALPLTGTFAGGVVVDNASGALLDAQRVTLTVKSLRQVSATYANAVNVCTHRLRLTEITRPGVEYIFDVPSLGGNCIPAPQRYRLYWLDHARVALQLTYRTGWTISGLLFRR